MSGHAPALDPELASVLTGVPSVPLTSENLMDARWRRAPLSPGDGSAKRVFCSTEANRVPLRVHTPVARVGVARRSCLLWIHSGGHVLDNWRSNGELLDEWASRLDAVVVAPSYAISPERPYPAALDDCDETFDWIVGNADELGIDPNRICVVGVSAGGGLAAALGLRLRDRGGVAAAAQMLVYPMLDDRSATESANWSGAAVWPKESNRFGWQAYLSDVQEPVPSTAAPARADDLTGLPATYLVVGTADLFLDEVLTFGRRLVDADVPVDLHVYAGAPHGFVSLGSQTRIGRCAVGDMTDWMATRLADYPGSDVPVTIAEGVA